jgi:hypothetical protein
MRQRSCAIPILLAVVWMLLVMATLTPAVAAEGGDDRITGILIYNEPEAMRQSALGLGVPEKPFCWITPDSAPTVAASAPATSFA